MRSKLVMTLATLLAISMIGAVPSLAQDAPPDGKGPEATPGRPQVDVPEQSNRPRRHAPCVQGTAFIAELEGHELLETGAFPCDRVDLLSFFTNDEIGGGLFAPDGRGSDVWGWTDPETGREYVLAGLEVGTSIIDITDPKRPVYLAHIPTSASNNLIWRDIKVYQDHAFIVAESSNHRMQIFDLTRLRDLDPAGAPHTLTEDAIYDGFQRAHNIWINEDSGYAYAIGQRNDTMGCSQSLHMIDISDPLNPTFAGCYNEDGNIHDALCVNYEGPDARFTGREICVLSSPGGPTGNTVTTVDVTDKSNPVTLSIAEYPDRQFSHQGAFVNGHRYYLHGIESTNRNPQAIEIFDFLSLTEPQHIGRFATPAQSTHHNLYQADDGYVYMSNYSSGLRVLDVSNVADGEIEEVGYFDVFPPDDDEGFGFGTWSNYPFFESGVVAVHGYQGLWLVKFRGGQS